MTYLSGIDILNDHTQQIPPKGNIALLTSSSTVDRSGVPVYHTLKRLLGSRLRAIWTLQHGFFLDKQDNMILSDSFYWPELHIQFRSLYNNNLLPDEGWLSGIKTLIIDYVDVGTRVYTFLNHIIKIMQFLSDKDIDMMILDRPNPLNGLTREGNILQPEFSSLVGMIPVPMRHSLTAAEYLSYASNYYDLKLNIDIIKVKGWSRKEFVDNNWIYPSPNMPSFSTALVYPGAVLLEGTNLSEGRGTTRPFEFVGAPFINNLKVVDSLKKLSIPQTTFVPIFFKPEFSKYKNEICQGIFINPQNNHEFRSFQTFYELIRKIRHQYPDQFQWQQPPYEFEHQRLPIDMITGSDFIRNRIDNNTPFSDIQPVIEKEIQEYQHQITPFLLY